MVLHVPFSSSPHPTISLLSPALPWPSPPPPCSSSPQPRSLVGQVLLQQDRLEGKVSHYLPLVYRQHHDIATPPAVSAASVWGVCIGVHTRQRVCVCGVCVWCVWCVCVCGVCVWCVCVCVCACVCAVRVRVCVCVCVCMCVCVIGTLSSPLLTVASLRAVSQFVH